MRVGVTGSRDWSEWAVIAEALIEARNSPPSAVPAMPVALGRRMTLVHGACPMRNKRSADAIAAYYALRWNWTVEPHPADWNGPCDPSFGCRSGHRRKRRNSSSDYCPMAGHRRNQVVVDGGMDLLLAFFQPGAPNKGTRDCVDRAIAAGLTEEQIRCYGDVPSDLAKYGVLERGNR